MAYEMRALLFGWFDSPVDVDIVSWYLGQRRDIHGAMVSMSGFGCRLCRSVFDHGRGLISLFVRVRLANEAHRCWC